MDPNIGKATGKERTVATCKESLPTSSSPHRKRFLEVQAEIRGTWRATDRLCLQKRMHRQNAIWIETFLEGVTDKSTGLPLFSELVWFVYKVSGVMCSVSACEHYWSIEGWIHSQRRNRLDQKLVEKLVRVHTNLCWGRVWITHYVIYYRGTKSLSSMSPLMRKKRNRKTKFKCGLLLLKPTWSVESQDACMLL